MRSPTLSTAGGVLTIHDNYANQLLPALLVMLGIVAVFVNSRSLAGFLIGLGLVAVGLVGFVRQSVIMDSTRQIVIFKRSLFGLHISACYPLRSIKGVGTRRFKFGDILVIGISEGRRHRTIRVAGPTRADLNTVVQEIRRYLAA
jgi:hypothetical protein